MWSEGVIGIPDAKDKKKHTKCHCRLPNYLNMKVNNLITLSEKVIARV